MGELPAETQIALLRVLQEREFERVGGNKPIRADVPRDYRYESRFADSDIRSDLFYRLNVFPIHIPPLRQRKEDIPVLVEYFIARFARNAGKQFAELIRRYLNYSVLSVARKHSRITECYRTFCEKDATLKTSLWIRAGLLPNIRNRRCPRKP